VGHPSNKSQKFEHVIQNVGHGTGHGLVPYSNNLGETGIVAYSVGYRRGSLEWSSQGSFFVICWTLDVYDPPLISRHI
jgi:hypothetical protein